MSSGAPPAQSWLAPHSSTLLWGKHPTAQTPLAAWFRVMSTVEVADFSALKKVFGTADYLAPFTIFDVGGNKYRVIAHIKYKGRRVYIRHVFTHREYDDWSYKMRQTKRSKR
jgi:mRNA interferase HigB